MLVGLKDLTIEDSVDSGVSPVTPVRVARDDRVKLYYSYSSDFFSGDLQTIWSELRKDAGEIAEVTGPYFEEKLLPPILAEVNLDAIMEHLRKRKKLVSHMVIVNNENVTEEYWSLFPSTLR